MLLKHLVYLIFGLISGKFEISKLSQKASSKSNHGSSSGQDLHSLEIYCNLLAEK